jgi:nicotinamidase-related amidase
MRTLSSGTSLLLVIDVQVRLLPAIAQASAAIANVRRLVAGAALVDVPVLFTEQNPTGLGRTVDGLVPEAGAEVVHKMSFDAVRAPGFMQRLPDRRDIVLVGCEAHVCVLQTALGLLDAGRRVFVASDAVGSRVVESKETAIRRMERHGAEVVTTEMVLFEWLGTADHPRFREAVALIK